MNKVIITKADVSHLEAIQNLGKETFYETFAKTNTEEDMEKYLNQSFSTKKLKQELNNPESSFYLAKINEEKTGYLKINWGNAQTEKVGFIALEIERIYVLNRFQGKKVGQALFEQAINVANRKNIKYLWLGVWEENPKAILFYKKNGFTVFDKHAFIVGDDIQTDLLMKTKLN